MIARTDPIGRTALRFSATASGLVLVAAVVSASVRLLPWVLDPRVARETLAPFAKSLLVIAFEVALLTGWPLGWALAAARLVDRGEARALASLGESPGRTAARLLPQGLLFAALLGLASFSLGRTSAAPGQVVDALLHEGRAACARAETPTTSSVPFVSATWLCGAGNEPRLVGRSPLGGIVFTAGGASVSDDLRRIELSDARVSVGPTEARVRLHVGTLTLRGLAPFTVASPLAPWARALVLVLSGAGAGTAAVVMLLRGLRDLPLRRQEGRAAARRTGVVVAAVLGAVGPTSALGALRALELRMPEGASLGPGWALMLAGVPLVAILMVIATSAIAAAVSRRLDR